MALPFASDRKNRRWRWPLAVAVIVCCIVFLPQLILQQWGPSILSSALGKQLHTSVIIEGVTGGWLSGLEIKRLEIAESAARHAPVLLRMERLAVNLAAGRLLVTSEPLILRIDELNVHLRRRDDGQWNAADLLSTLRTGNSKPSKAHVLLTLLKRRIALSLPHGRLHLGEGDEIYTFKLKAETPSLISEPVQWQFDLSGDKGANLALRGQVQHLITPEPPVGHVEVQSSQLDVDVITALLPLDATMQPRGLIHSARIRLDLGGVEGLGVDVDLDLRQLHLQAATHTAASTLDHLQLRLQGRLKGAYLSCDTLSIDVPGGRFALRDRGWLETTDAAWRGHAAFALDVDDMAPITRVLQSLLPPDLRLQGGLKIAGKAEGAVSRDARKPLDTRLSELEADLDGGLDSVTWGRETISKVVTTLRLKQGVLTIPQMTANAFGGSVAVKGELPLAEGVPGIGLEWRLANIPLHEVLGEPLQHFFISHANGRITHDGEVYRTQSVVRISEVRLDPAELDDREFRLTQVVVQCNATHTLPLIRLGFDGCSIKSPEMRLSLHQGKLELGATPQLSMQLKGELSGGFVNALVPEVPVKFTESVAVRGPYRIRLQGNVWVGMQWDLAVRSDRFIFDEMTFTDLQTRVVKAIGRLDIADLQVKRSAGRVTGSGAWRLGKPAEGSLNLYAHQLPVQQTLEPESRGKPYIVEGTVNGPVTIRTGKQGWQVTTDEQVRELRLRKASIMLAGPSTGRIQGHIGRDRRGSLWARQLEFKGDDLSIALRRGRLPLPVTAQTDFELDAALGADAAWVSAGLALAGVSGVAVSGRTEGTVQMQGKVKNTLKTMRGGGTLQIAGVSVQDHALSGVDITYGLVPDRLQISKGSMVYQDGKVDLQGSLGLPPSLTTPGDQLRVTLRRIPLDYTQQLRGFRKLGPAMLSTHSVLDGQIRLDVTQERRLSGELHLEMDKTTRQIRQDGRIVEEIEVPAIRLTSDVSSTRPQERWAINSLRLQGQDVDIEFKQIDFELTPSHLDVAAALQLKVVGEASRGLSIGFLPALIELHDTVELGGSAGLRIPLQGKIEPRHISYAGHVHLQNLLLEGIKAGPLTADLNLAQGRLAVEEARVEVLGGEVRVDAPSFVDVQGPMHDFDAHVKAERLNLQIYHGRKVALSRVLFLLVPLFIVEPEKGNPTDISGVFSGDMALSGRFSQAPGWSKTISGEGSFRIDHGAIKGSTLVAGFTTKTVLLPWNTVHNALTGMFSKDGKVGSEIASMGKKAFVFGSIESPIQVRDGEVHLRQDFAIRSPEFGMMINGHSTLEGEMDYLVRTDLIERLRFGSVTSLPNKIPLVGKLIRYVNPFTLLDGIELESTVQGNIFRTNDEGKRDVRLKTSIISRKKKPERDS